MGMTISACSLVPMQVSLLLRGGLGMRLMHYVLTSFPDAYHGAIIIGILPVMYTVMLCILLCYVYCYVMYTVVFMYTVMCMYIPCMHFVSSRCLSLQLYNCRIHPPTLQCIKSVSTFTFLSGSKIVDINWQQKSTTTSKK